LLLFFRFCCFILSFFFCSFPVVFPYFFLWSGCLPLLLLLPLLPRLPLLLLLPLQPLPQLMLLNNPDVGRADDALGAGRSPLMLPTLRSSGHMMHWVPPLRPLLPRLLPLLLPRLLLQMGVCRMGARAH